MPTKPDKFQKYFQKNVEMETTRNAIMRGRFCDWDKETITIEKVISNEPYRVQMKTIERYMIKNIKILDIDTKTEEKAQPEQQEQEIKGEEAGGNR